MAIKKRNYSINSPHPVVKSKHLNLSNFKVISTTIDKSQFNISKTETVHVDYNNTLLTSADHLADLNQAISVANDVVMFQSSYASSRDQDQAVDNSEYGLLTYGIVPHYNYYAPQYEEMIESMDENQLINAYISYANGDSNSGGSFRHFSNVSISKKTFLESQKRTSIDYLPTDNSIIDSDRIVYPQDYNFAKISSQKDMFPFGVDISVGIDNKNTKFKNFLRKSKMYEKFVEIANRASSTSLNMRIDGTGETPDIEKIIGMDLLNSNLGSFISTRSSASEVYFSEQQDSMHGMALKLTLLQGFLRKLSIDKSLTLPEILVGKKNYYEPVFYKIEKSIGAGPRPMRQSYIVPASGNILKYFDTQIKAGVVYTYRITEYAITISNKIDSLNPSFELSEDTNHQTIESSLTPSVYLVQVPMVRDIVSAVCDPSQRPRMEFYTRNDYHNKIFMRIHSTSVGEVTEPFSPIMDSDIQNIETLNYKNRFFDNYVFSNKHSEIQSYEVFHLRQKPEKLTDFSNGISYFIDDNLIYGNALVSVNIKPNEKNYFICRSINQHGLISNSSVVYEVELLRGSDVSKIIVNTYVFKKHKKYYMFREMKKLIQITPAAEHTSYETPDDPDTYKRHLDKVGLGEAEVPIWGEKFKIRLTSNNTGRKIDFNLDFNLIKKKTPEEIK